MRHYITSTNGLLTQTEAKLLHGLCSQQQLGHAATASDELQHGSRTASRPTPPKLALSGRGRTLLLGLLVATACCLSADVAQAQYRDRPSHHKIRLDSYKYLLRDVHPASQAQANYLQNRLFLSGLKKSERLERRQRLDAYEERRIVKKIERYRNVARQLSAGHTTMPSKLNTFWTLVSVYGDHAEVYEALSSGVPSMTHDDFVSTRQFLRIVLPSGELANPPLLLQTFEGLEPGEFQQTWSSLAERLKETGQVAVDDVAQFRVSVEAYCRHADVVVTRGVPISGRLEAKKYVASLGSLADALYRPKQREQVQQYVLQGGYAFYGDNVLGLIQHMLRNNVLPAKGSTAQLALAEVARPIQRLLDEEIAMHLERIDSLDTDEGHRPYARDYGTYGGQVSSVPSPGISPKSS